MDYLLTYKSRFLSAPPISPFYYATHRGSIVTPILIDLHNLSVPKPKEGNCTAGKLIISCPHTGNSNNQIIGNHFYPFHMTMPFSRILAVGHDKLVHRKLLIGVVPVNDRARRKIRL
jgi:hypothetical protein